LTQIEDDIIDEKNTTIEITYEEYRSRAHIFRKKLFSETYTDSKPYRIYQSNYGLDLRLGNPYHLLFL